MKARKTLLANLVRTLVEEWGPEEVSLALSKTMHHVTSGESAGLVPSRRRHTPLRTKPSAVELVRSETYPEDRKEALTKIALRFDERDFLPSVADIREFLILEGMKPGDIKDRRDAFRVVHKALSDLSLDRLEQISKSALHSGPGQLGTLSDAINETSARFLAISEGTSDASSKAE